MPYSKWNVGIALNLGLYTIISKAINHMETILIAGGTGLIGLELSKIFIEKGYRVRILSRRKLRSKEMEYFAYSANHYVQLARRYQTG